MNRIPHLLTVMRDEDELETRAHPRLRWDASTTGPEAGPLQFELKPGSNTLGRDRANDVIIDDPTVSDRHCQIQVGTEGATVTDLGSTNGTFVEEEPVETAAIRPGQRLRVGTIVLVFEGSTGAPSSASAPLALEEARAATEPIRACCAQHPESRATWVCTECHRWLCGGCVKQLKLDGAGVVTLCKSCDGLCERVERSVDPAALPGSHGLVEALVYPLRGTALFVILAATAFAAVTSALGGSPAGASGGLQLPSIFSMARGIAGYGLVLTGFGMGAYILNFLRQVVVSSTRGEADPPNWPELDLDGIREVLTEFFGWGLVCFGPAVVWRVWQQPETETTRMIGLALFVAGGLYGGMALLAMVIYDNVAALNPLLVLVSIARVPIRYLSFCLFVAALVAVKVSLEHLLAPGEWPRLAAVVESAWSTYAVIAALRGLGWFYRGAEEKLAWS